MKRASITLLTVCGIEELEQHTATGVTHVLSILDPGTPDPESFLRFPSHHRTLLRFHDIVEAQPGMILPERKDVQQIVDFGEELVDDLEEGSDGHLLIHCHLGISRSTAAMAIMLAEANAQESDEEIVGRLVKIRPKSWPNLRMIGFADEILDRGGRLKAAVSRLHARQLAARPELADTFRRLGRSWEVDEAMAAAA